MPRLIIPGGTVSLARRVVTLAACAVAAGGLLPLAAPPAVTATSPADVAPEAPDTRGREFWLVFPGNYDSFDPSAELSPFITGDRAASGRVDVPEISSTQEFTVRRRQVTTVVLPSSAQLTVQDGKQPRGIPVPPLPRPPIPVLR